MTIIKMRNWFGSYNQN